MIAKDFLSIRDFTPDDIRHFLHVACQVKAKPEQFAEALKGQTLAMIFEKPSLRTRVTFDVGMEQLGGHSIYLSPAEINMGKRESVHDVAKNLERMVQGIMIRTFGHEIVVELAKHAGIPVINGLTDYSHPCQALADYLTMLEVKGQISGLKVAYIGDGNNVSRSLMFAGAQLGANVWVATPPGFQPDGESVGWCRQRCEETRGAITVTNDPEMACFNADVVYTDVWASMGQEDDLERRKAAFEQYQVNASLMRHAKPEAIFLHCLPAHRGDEVTDDVIDSARSFVFQQAENRLHAQKAILLELLWDKAVEARPVRMAREAVMELVR
jgi:ornithine carbamoyltransferase